MDARAPRRIVASGLALLALAYALTTLSWLASLASPSFGLEKVTGWIFVATFSSFYSLYVGTMLQGIFLPMIEPFGPYQALFLIGFVVGAPLTWLALALWKGRAWARHVAVAFAGIVTVGSVVYAIASIVGGGRGSTVGNAAVALAAGAATWALTRRVETTRAG